MNYFRLLRPEQWVKNVFVLLPLLFSGNLFSSNALVNALIAVLSFCAISSSTYIINDFVDRKKDLLNPEKMHRPIASGAVNLLSASVLSAILICVSLLLAFLLNLNVIYTIIGYFILSQFYTFWLKNEVFADIIIIAINFVLRAVAGAFAIDVYVSPWLIVGVFFLALFIAVNKRKGELLFLKQPFLCRKTLSNYTADLLSRLSSLATNTLVISYALFVFFGEHQGLFITLPIALYVILRYDLLASSGNKIARHPHLVLTDSHLCIGIILWALLTVMVLY